MVAARSAIKMTSRPKAAFNARVLENSRRQRLLTCRAVELVVPVLVVVEPVLVLELVLEPA
ncbi:hypothetical protein ES707_09640 [subsurface metagenome]